MLDPYSEHFGIFVIMEEQEAWKPVVGYEGLYEISNMGNLRSVTRIVAQGNKQNTLIGKPMALSKDRYGYLYCALSKNGKRKRYLVHRMVAEAFIECNNPQMYCVDHINTIRTDNRVSNLRFATIESNNRNPLTLRKLKVALNNKELQKRRIETLSTNGCKRPPREVFMYDLNNVFIRSFSTMLEAANFINTNRGNIHHALYKQKEHIHKGYKWYDRRIEPTQ